MFTQNQIDAMLKAVTDTQVSRVRELLASGADPNSSDPWGRTALQMAVRYAYNNEADALLIVEALLGDGAAINAADEDGLTALFHAAIYSYPELLNRLIAEGANVNHRNSDGQTAISLIESTPSLARKRSRIVKILEQAGGVP